MKIKAEAELDKPLTTEEIERMNEMYNTIFGEYVDTGFPYIALEDRPGNYEQRIAQANIFWDIVKQG